MHAVEAEKEFFAAVAVIAESHRRHFQELESNERFAHLRNVLENTGIVFAVWPDTGSEEGIGFLGVKGDDQMPAYPDPSILAQISAIPCVGAEAAVSLREAWARSHPTPSPHGAIAPRKRRRLLDIIKIAKAA